MSTIITIEEDTAAFELVQRQAKLLSTSTLVPKEFQGNMANCAIGLNIAKRLGADAFMVLQNIDIIHGRPSFRATFLIAMVNASGRFSPLQFRMEGDGATRSCVAHAKTKEDGETVEGPQITMAMAKAEGWSTKAGSKWVTMPELMLRYRAAAFFARIYAPDITLGMHTAEEAADMEPEMRNATPSGLTKSNPLIAENPFKDKSPEPEKAQETKDSTPEKANDDEARFEAMRGLREAIKEAEITEDAFWGRAKANGWIKKTTLPNEMKAEELVDLTNNIQAIADGEKKGGDQ